MKNRFVATVNFILQIAVFVWICAASIGLLIVDRRMNCLSAELVQARVALVECRDKVDVLNCRTTDHTVWIQQLQVIANEKENQK